MTFTFTRIANTDTPIPNGTENFTGFGYYIEDGETNFSDLTWPAINENGNIAFLGRKFENQQGIYTDINGLNLVADTNTPIPNNPIPDETDTFLTFQPPIINNNGNVSFRGILALNDNFNGSLFDTGIYTDIGGLNQVADINTTIPGSTETFDSFGFLPSLNDNGNIAFYGEISDFGFPGFQGIYTHIGGINLIADTNTPIPGTTENFEGFGTLSFNNNETVAFVGFTDTTFTEPAIYYSNSEGILTSIIDTKTPIPNSTENFSNLSTPILNNNDEIVFAASQDLSGNFGIYTNNIGGINVVADVNTSIPDGVGNFTGFTSEDPDNISFDSFVSDLYSINDSGKVAFIGVGIDEQQGIYTNLNNVLEKVVDRNTSLEGKTISDLAFGWYGLNENQIAFTAQFTDETEGIYVATNAPVSLSLNIDIDNISEADGENAATVTITRTGGTATPLEVNLTSSDTTEVTVSSIVTIPLDQTSVTFSVDAIDDLIDDGDQTVNLTATATGYTEDTIEFIVTDNDDPPPPPEDQIINGDSGPDTLIGGMGNDTLNGRLGKDKLFGKSGNDLLIGRPGNDILLAGDGDDTLEGGTGRDRLNGGPGDDVLTGGGSIDRFIFNTNEPFQPEDVGVDQITDFSQTQGDIILLDRRTFTAINSELGEGFSIASEFVIVSDDELAETAEAVIVYNSSNGNLFYNPNGSETGFGDGGQFATLTNTPLLAAGDFFLR
ncbi:MAG: hypothetical protein QNJ68_16770 [Microcoleaceae cyanobacterium MO_207.B10]|nr:hypothetical protein [Microcoleaceae cyanobacterium MO_207.B10]